MKIHREIGGVSYDFELTEEELFIAYYEQESLFDESNVVELVADLDDDAVLASYGIHKEEFLALRGQIADQMREYIDSGNVLWYDAREFAAENVIADYIRLRDSCGC